MIFAQIKDAQIVNTIILDDEKLASSFMLNPVTGENFDQILRVDTIYPQPAIGWSFDGIVFQAPPVASVEE